MKEAERTIEREILSEAVLISLTRLIRHLGIIPPSRQLYKPNKKPCKNTLINPDKEDSFLHAHFFVLNSSSNESQSLVLQDDVQGVYDSWDETSDC